MDTYVVKQHWINDGAVLRTFASAVHTARIWIFLLWCAEPVSVVTEAATLELNNRTSFGQSLDHHDNKHVYFKLSNNI